MSRPSAYKPSSRRGISLTLRVSLLLVLAVVIPLIITVVGSELILRPTLLSQAGVEMSNDAQSHQATIDAMFISRLQELETLRNFFAVQKFLQGDTQYEQQAANELALGSHLDDNYLSWALFTTQGKHLISYPPITPTPRGKYLIPPEILSQMQKSDKPLISSVYFDANTNSAFVDLYAPVISGQKKFIGIARSTLGLAQIWTAVNNETNAAPGGFAMIVDGNGIRIAYTNNDASLTTQPLELFKSIEPLTTQMQQRIRDENLYGNSHAAVTTLDDPELVKQIDDTEANPLFQFTPARTDQSYQAY
ncbi:MAG TPA: cache domain-containing protein, partial [Ktedonobacteraceae bacterium]|nr:cache domain-containing protein [Ktedonobacteraceae bacterium]